MLRTTPLFALSLLAAYFLVSYRVALTGLGVARPPAGLPSAQALTWLGRWRMFTELRPEHVDLLAEVRTSDWSAVDLAARYPCRWDEGPGWLRDDWLGDPRRLAELTNDLCAQTGATEVRLTEIRWPKTLGSREQPRIGERRTTLHGGACP
jgi:hypothetical protein